MQRIYMMLDDFETIEFYHIRRENNVLEDEQALKVEQGELREDEDTLSICHIP